nr:MAG: hypothetical protein [Equine parapoxvirus]WNT71219.1 MAG: hypothetical protein [Equine parapoxvirus]
MSDAEGGGERPPFRRFASSRQAFRGRRRAPGTEPHVHPRRRVTFAREGGSLGRSQPHESPSSEAAPARELREPPQRVQASAPMSPAVGLLERRVCSDITALTPLPACVGEEEAGCWLELSAAVRGRRAVGFPVCRRAAAGSSGAVALFFESFGQLSAQPRSAGAECPFPDALVFQTVAIMYQLYQRGIYCDDVCVDVVAVPPSTIPFSVSQLVFQVSTSGLVVLSPRTRLYRADLPQSCYLDAVRALMPASARAACEGYGYFVEWIVRHHLDMLSRHVVDLFRAQRRLLSGAPLHRRAAPGTLVRVAREDAVVLGVTMTEVSISDNVRVLWSSDGAVFEVDDFPLHDVFAAPDIVTRVRAAACL